MNKVNAIILARVSTKHQSVNSQLTSLQSYCRERSYNVVRTIQSTVTGNTTNKKREDLIELMDFINNSDIPIHKLIITEISRLGRRPTETRNLLDQLHEKGISVVFKQLNVESLDDDGNETLISRLIISIFSEFANSERLILSSRIKAGLEHARKTKSLGRPVGSGEDETEFLQKYKHVIKDLKNGVSIRKSSKLHDVSHTTVIKIKRLAEIA